MKISLRRREVESIDLSPNVQLRLTTRDGAAWVTISGNADDFVLTSSNPLEFTGPGHLVIEALDDEMVVHATILRSLAGNEILAVAS